MYKPLLLGTRTLVKPDVSRSVALLNEEKDKYGVSQVMPTTRSGCRLGWSERTISAAQMRCHTIVSKSAKFTSIRRILVKNLKWVIRK
jgi:hypothetical protein